MTAPELTETMRRATADLAPESSERILERALVAGSRQRLRHRAAVGLSAAAVLGVVATTVVLANSPRDTGPGTPVAAASKSAQPSGSPTYAPGSATEVPGGPVIPTNRTIIDDASLKQVARELVGNDSLTGLSVQHIAGSGSSQHLADTTTDGRVLSFQLDGAAAWIGIGRWDGYHAVGFPDDFQVSSNSLADIRRRPTGQKVAYTAQEACGGAYRTYPAIACTESPEGWYSVTRPNAGTQVAGAKELWVDLYTEDGWVIRVHSLNTPGEKQGPKISDETAVSQADSLDIARSARWFTAR